MEPLKILFVEDLPTDYELAEWHLRKNDLEFLSICVDTQTEFLKALDTFEPDLIISDYSMPEFNGLQALQLTLEHKPEIPFIILTGSINEETAVLCMKAGATDYVLKEKMHRLPFSVRETMKRASDREGKIQAERQMHASEEKFRDIFESANVGKAITTGTETISVNQAFADMLGYKREDLEKLPWQDITPPEDIKKTAKMVNALHNGEVDAVRYEKRYIHKNG
jgi:DNA-binding NtrC family response regulator